MGSYDESIWVHMSPWGCYISAESFATGAKQEGWGWLWRVIANLCPVRHVYFSCTGNVVEEVSLLTSPFPGSLIKSEHEACNESWEVDHVEWTEFYDAWGAVNRPCSSFCIIRSSLTESVHLCGFKMSLFTGLLFGATWWVQPRIMTSSRSLMILIWNSVLSSWSQTVPKRSAPKQINRWRPSNAGVAWRRLCSARLARLRIWEPKRPANDLRDLGLRETEQFFIGTWLKRVETSGLYTFTIFHIPTWKNPVFTYVHTDCR